MIQMDFISVNQEAELLKYHLPTLKETVSEQRRTRMRRDTE